MGVEDHVQSEESPISNMKNDFDYLSKRPVRKVRKTAAEITNCREYALFFI